MSTSPKEQKQGSLYSVFYGALFDVRAYNIFLPFFNTNQVPEKLYLGQWPFLTKSYRVNALYDVRAYTVTVSQHESYNQCNLSAIIELVHDELKS